MSEQTKEQVTLEDLAVVRRAIRQMDCGHHYCRYCDAGSGNQWQHRENCAYAESVKDAEAAREIIRRLESSIL